MTNQEAFDVMVRHLRQQGMRSLSENGETCAYRGANGLKCVVGALIPDEEYTADMDRLLIGVGELMHLPSLRGLDRHFLAKMQEGHDHTAPEGWEHWFEYVANMYHLTLPPLESEASHA